MKEDRESWKNFFVWLKERELTGVRLFIGGVAPNSRGHSPE
jgi:hypothetical protein